MAAREADTEIDSTRMFIEAKLLYLDLKENTYGRFLKVVEVNNGKRTTIIIPESGLTKFAEAINDIVERNPPASSKPRARAAAGGAGAKKATAAPADAPAPAAATNKLNVFNLPFETTDEELLELFASSGATSAVVLTRRDGRSLGQGVVTFESVEDATQAMET